MNVYYYADLDARPFEGRTRTATILKKFLEEQGINFVTRIEDADLIHVHSSGIADVFKAAEWQKKYGKPVIYSLYSICETEALGHFVNHLQQRYYLGKRKTHFLLSYSAVLPLSWRAFPGRKFAAITVASPYTQQKLFPNTKLIRIGVDTNYFKPSPKGKNDKIKVGYFGHPSVYKGLIDFVRASKLFPPSVETYAFLSRKDEKIENSLRALNTKIIIRGYTDNIVAAYNEMDIIIAPHRSKLGSVANPLVILEAMACGKAVITTNLPFIQEIVGNAAITVNPSQPREIALAVEKLQNTELRENLEQKARERIVQEFTLEKMFQDYLQLYQTIAEKE